MKSKQEVIARLQAEVDEWKKTLTEMESGKLQFAQRAAASYEWSDTTPSEIAWHKSAIANHEAVISHLKAHLP